jgi:hypothetical protein
MMVLVFFLIFALLFGFGFAFNWLWFLAVLYLVFWLIGVAIGRGERAGRYRFYRW